MTDIIETQLLINNKLVPASNNGTFELFSPHTNNLVAKGKLYTHNVYLNIPND
jgi:aldehyde dehydrogenase (NAD+)